MSYGKLSDLSSPLRVAVAQGIDQLIDDGAGREFESRQ